MQRQEEANAQECLETCLKKEEGAYLKKKKTKKIKKSMAIIDSVGVHDIKALQRMYRTKQV